MTVTTTAHAAHIPTSRRDRRQAVRRQVRAYAREHGHRVTGHVQRALCLAPAGWTAREYLQGLGFAEWERFESAFGRQVAKTYRENHGQEPDRGARVVLRGRVWSAMRYRDEKDLYAGALAYPGTAGLLAG